MVTTFKVGRCRWNLPDGRMCVYSASAALGISTDPSHVPFSARVIVEETMQAWRKVDTYLHDHPMVVHGIDPRLAPEPKRVTKARVEPAADDTPF